MGLHSIANAGIYRDSVSGHKEHAMQQMGSKALVSGAERRMPEVVVETLATVCNREETAAEVAHDARNRVTVLGLHCDLLAQFASVIEQTSIAASFFTSLRRFEIELPVRKAHRM